MFWDVAIAFGIGLCQLGITWYAVDISVKENRKKNAVVIGIVGLFGILLTVVGVIRNSAAQNAAKRDADAKQKQTEAQLNQVQGKLDTITQFVAHPPANFDPKQIAAAVHAMAGPEIGRVSSLKLELQVLSRDITYFLAEQEKKDPANVPGFNKPDPESQSGRAKAIRNYMTEATNEFEMGFFENRITPTLQAVSQRGVNVNEASNTCARASLADKNLDPIRDCALAIGALADKVH